MNDLSFVRICKFLLLIGASVPAAMGTEKGNLRVGAARVDITPPEDAALPMSGYAGRKQGFKAIHDHIFARAIVLDDGTTQAALVAWELVAVPNSVWEAVSHRVAKEVTRVDRAQTMNDKIQSVKQKLAADEPEPGL
jgi:hypothetical protein